MEKTLRIEKRREFAFVLYPESAVSCWKEILVQLKQRIFYILHDRDVEGTGELKKPHYHVMVMYDSPRASSTVSKVACKCGGSGFLEPLVSRRGYARYLIHLDNPEKYQYLPSEVVALNGANYDVEIKSKSELKNDRLRLISEILHFCDLNNIHVYSDLVRYCSEYKQDWLEVLITYSGQIVKDYIKSNAYAYLHAEDLNRFKV